MSQRRTCRVELILSISPWSIPHELGEGLGGRDINPLLSTCYVICSLAMLYVAAIKPKSVCCRVKGTLDSWVRLYSEMLYGVDCLVYMGGGYECREKRRTKRQIKGHQGR